MEILIAYLTKEMDGGLIAGGLTNGQWKHFNSSLNDRQMAHMSMITLTYRIIIFFFYCFELLNLVFRV